MQNKLVGIKKKLTTMYCDKLSSEKLGVKIFLYIENDLSTSTEVIGVISYLNNYLN